jgi:hypothetical protein
MTLSKVPSFPALLVTPILISWRNSSTRDWRRIRSRSEAKSGFMVVLNVSVIVLTIIRIQCMSTESVPFFAHAVYSDIAVNVC